MADGDPIPHDARKPLVGMHKAQILNIRLSANTNRLAVAANHGAEPNT